MTTFNYELTGTDNEVKDFQLDLLRANLAKPVYPGYPDFDDRLFIEPGEEEYTPGGRLILPNGPWEINNHPNRNECNEQPELFGSIALLGMGLQLDSKSRPLHPWVKDMLNDPAIGVVTGKGFYRNWGPNKTADPIVIYRDSILLVERGDTGSWALPGGFIDPGETAIKAAIRETEEETGITLASNTPIEEVYDGQVIDVRATANAWPETTAYLIKVDDDIELPDPRGSSENPKSSWIPLDVIDRGEVLFGAHKYLVRLALEALK